MNSTIENVSCAEARLIGGPLLISKTATDAFRYVQIILFIIGFPIALVLNTLVIILVAKVKKLQQTSFYLALQVIVVDLLITLIQFPTTTANVIADRWVFGAIGCPTIGFFLFTFRNMRNFLMFVFVTDRLLTVFTPFWYYRGNRRNYIVGALSFAAWFFAILYGLIPMPFILDCHEYGRIAWGCTVSNGCKYPAICDAYKNTSVVLSNIVGGVIPLIMYVILFCKARQLKRRLPTYALSKVTVDIALQESSSQDRDSLSKKNYADRKDSVISIALRSDQSNDVEEKQSQDKTATITFAFLFLALIGVSLPSTFFFVVGSSAYRAQGMRPPESFIIFSTIFRTFFNFLVIIDPIAIMRNRDVKIVLKRWYGDLIYKLQRRKARPVQKATNGTGKNDSEYDLKFVILQNKA